jgi:GNAT superfamily N-acetyltransferase
MKSEGGKVRFVSGGEELLESLHPLWIRLREHVIARSTNFPKEMSKLTWEERKSEILCKGRGTSILVDMAIDDGGHPVGYCISTITPSKEGEIDSIFVEGEWRGKGLGGQLMDRAVRWLDESGAQVNRLVATWGNDEVLGFYAKHGFLPRRIVLERKIQ